MGPIWPSSGKPLQQVTNHRMRHVIVATGNMQAPMDRSLCQDWHGVLRKCFKNMNSHNWQVGGAYPNVDIFRHQLSAVEVFFVTFNFGQVGPSRI